MARNLSKFLFSGDDMVVELGFVIQGENSAELPERVFSGFRFYHLSLDQSKMIECSCLLTNRSLLIQNSYDCFCVIASTFHSLHTHFPLSYTHCNVPEILSAMKSAQQGLTSVQNSTVSAADEAEIRCP